MIFLRFYEKKSFFNLGIPLILKFPITISNIMVIPLFLNFTNVRSIQLGERPGHPWTS